MEILSKSTKKTKELAYQIAKKIKVGDVLALYGDLGSGKTTFVRYLVEALQIPARVQSPTFVIARKYEKETGKIRTINHIDLYRLTTKEEVTDLGLLETMSEENSITLIEWPKIAENLLPKDLIKIYFEYVDENTRRINEKSIDRHN